jgi:hypothetical protein
MCIEFKPGKTAQRLNAIARYVSHGINLDIVSLRHEDDKERLYKLLRFLLVSSKVIAEIFVPQRLQHLKSFIEINLVVIIYITQILAYLTILED